jgi:hypothetical protein
MRFGLYEITLEIDRLPKKSVERTAGTKVFFGLYIPSDDLSIPTLTSSDAFIFLIPEQLLESMYGPDNTFIEEMVTYRWEPIAHELPPVDPAVVKQMCEFGSFDASHFGDRFARDVAYAQKMFENCQTTVDDKGADELPPSPSVSTACSTEFVIFFS